MKLVFLVFLFLFLTSTIISQGPAYNQEFQVNTYTNNNQWNPSVAGTSDGGFVVCWESYGQDTFYEGIFCQIFDRNGIKVGVEIQVNSYTNWAQKYPRVCGLTDGGFVICWRSIDQDGSSWGVFAQMFDENGTMAGNEFQVNTYYNDSQAGQEISELNSGGFVICWNSSGQDGSDWGVYAKIYNENGLVISDEFQVNTYTTSGQFQPTVKNLDSGNFLICWVSDGQDGSSWGIFGQMFDENGQRIGDEFQVNLYTIGPQSNPGIGSRNESGDFTITWMSGDDGGGLGIFAQMFDKDGGRIGEEFQVNTYFIHQQTYPSISKLTYGGFVICWQSYFQNNNADEVYLQMFDSNGVRIGSELNVNSYHNYSQSSSTITNLTNGNFVICWESGVQDGNDFGVFGKYYLGKPINHHLNQFELLEPQDEDSLNFINPKMKWNRASETRINFQWELTYDLYLDNTMNFENPILELGIKDTTYQLDSLKQGETYYWKVLAREYYGDSLWSSTINCLTIDTNYVVNVKDFETPAPNSFALYQNYPNPFNPSTKIRFAVSPDNINSINVETHGHASLQLIIYDVLGNEIATLIDEPKPPGTYEIDFSADEFGLTSGVYFYQLSVGQFSETKKMLIMK